MSLEWKYLSDNISYIEPSDNPLSANVVMIKDNDKVWLYDVGNHPDIPDMLKNAIPTDTQVNIILSHFHPDHIGNINKLKYTELYQGKNTYKYTHSGNIVESDMYIKNSTTELHIFPIASSHAKGCIALEVNKEYCFVGDALYPANSKEFRRYNAGILLEGIRQLENISADKIMLSHKSRFQYPKSAILKWLKGIYAKRDKNSAYIDD